MYYKTWRIYIALLKWIDKTEIDKYTTGPWTNALFGWSKHCKAKLFKYMLFKKAQFLRSLLSKRVLLFQAKCSVPSYYEQECKSNEDCYQGFGVVIKMRIIHWDLYYKSCLPPHL